MHSDELKELIEEIMQNTESDALKVQCLNALAVNELNWGIFYTKESLKDLNVSLLSIKKTLNLVREELEGIKKELE